MKFWLHETSFQPFELSCDPATSPENSSFDLIEDYTHSSTLCFRNTSSLHEIHFRTKSSLHMLPQFPSSRSLSSQGNRSETPSTLLNSHKDLSSEPNLWSTIHLAMASKLRMGTSCANEKQQTEWIVLN